MPTFATMTRASSAYTCSTQELQSCQASTNPETSIAIQERPLYIRNLNRETSGDSKTRVSTLGRCTRCTRGPALPPPYCGAGAACGQIVTDSHRQCTRRTRGPVLPPPYCGAGAACGQRGRLHRGPPPASHQQPIHPCFGGHTPDLCHPGRCVTAPETCTPAS